MCDIAKEEYTIYTHDELGFEREFGITDMESFLDSQENLSTLVTEMESKVAFQRDLLYGIQNNFIACCDEQTGEDQSEEQIEYLGRAIESNLRVVRKIREYLGMNPEPDIKPSILTTEFLKSKAKFN